MSKSLTALLAAAVSAAALSGCSLGGSGDPSDPSAQTAAAGRPRGSAAGTPSSSPLMTGQPSVVPTQSTISPPTSTTAPGGPDRCFNRRPTISGTSGDDRLTATSNVDVIVGLGGADVVEKAGSDDFVCTGAGDDTVRSTRRGRVFAVDLGTGADRASLTSASKVLGGPGNDRIVIDHNPATVAGGPGDDYLRSKALKQPRYLENAPCVDFRASRRPVRVDLRRGWARGEGRDRLVNFRCLTATRFDDVIIGSPQRDSVFALAGVDLVRTGPGNDTVLAGPNADRVYLGPGNDYGNGEVGWDRLYGEDGADSLEGWSDGDYLDGGPGNDQIYAALFCAHGGNSYDTDGLMDDAGNELFGGPGDDYLVGDKGNDRLDGGPGFDQGQGGYHDRRADWIDSMELVLGGCLTNVDLGRPFNAGG